jgi:transposase, IS5 family
MSKQITMVSLEDLVPTDHIYRRFCDLWKFKGVQNQLKDIEKDNNYKGYGAYAYLNACCYSSSKI